MSFPQCYLSLFTSVYKFQPWIPQTLISDEVLEVLEVLGTLDFDPAGYVLLPGSPVTSFGHASQSCHFSPSAASI